MSDLLRFDCALRSLYEVLRNEHGLRPVTGDVTIEASLASPDERRPLAQGSSGAVLRTSQKTCIDDGRPIESCESGFLGARYELTFGAGADRVEGAAVSAI